MPSMPFSAPVRQPGESMMNFRICFCALSFCSPCRARPGPPGDYWQRCTRPAMARRRAVSLAWRGMVIAFADQLPFLSWPAALTRAASPALGRMAHVMRYP